ncbi:GNAT family N-acetyltransferase [Streptomyces palmae]|uniref:N-acetyltransferase n=1 Tax=Streptomyces palmae TaxID=1701085 RepID=A0A4Z0FZ74_9ACTN|nr:GNAT family N-acetyltransferase [Streptomyces palmae]TGA87568.1 N-acetyltransferase [Streptomyces palmae]
MTVSLRAPGAPEAAALFLRPWRDEDAEPLIEAYRDPVLRQWTRIPVRDAAEAGSWLETQRQGWETGERLSFAVFEEGAEGREGPLVANAVLKRSHLRDGNPEVGYWTAAPARGRGVAPRALQALTDWAFADRGLARIELLHQVDNLASCRVAEKAGYRYHETLPALPPSFPLDGHLHIRESR